jgi:hypothetical protein
LQSDRDDRYGDMMDDSVVSCNSMFHDMMYDDPPNWDAYYGFPDYETEWDWYDSEIKPLPSGTEPSEPDDYFLDDYLPYEV